MATVHNDTLLLFLKSSLEFEEKGFSELDLAKIIDFGRLQLPSYMIPR